MTNITETQADAAADTNSNQIVAMFENYAKASAARDALEARGIERSRIKVLDKSGAAADTSSYDMQRDEGIWGSIKSFFMPDEDAHVYAEGVRRGYAVLVVQAGTADADKEAILSILDEQSPVDIDTHASGWREGGWSGVHAGQAAWETESGPSAGRPTIAESDRLSDSAPAPAGPAGAAREEVTAGGRSSESAPPTVGPGGESREQVIPVYEERLRVGKREVGRGSVRVRSYVVESPVEEQVRLHGERVDVERRPVDRVVNEGEVGAEPFRERTVEVTARGEEPVIDKEMRVKEEVAVRKEEADQTQTVRDSVRHTEVEVDDDRSDSRTAPGPTPNR